MRKPLFISLLTLFLCFLCLVVNPAKAYPADSFSAKAVSRGINYLSGMQNDDGGFASDKGRSSNITTTAWVMMALKAAGEDVNSENWAPKGHSPLDYLKSKNGSLEATTDYARILLALKAGGGGPVFQGINLAENIIAFQQPNGHFAQMGKGEQDLINSHMWSIIALASADVEIPHKGKALEWLVSCQNADGGFGWGVGLASDPDDTGIALITLVLLGEEPESSPTIQKALTYLHSQQDEEGGFKWTGQKSNAATDSWVIQGLAAVGADPESTQWQVQDNNPFTHLVSFQNTDGSFNWTNEVKSSPVLMTAYAIMALTNKPIPVNIDFTQPRSKPLNISLTVGSKEAVVNGQIKLLDAPPIIVNNRVLVPLRFVGGCLDASFRWVPETSTVEISYNGKTFSLIVGETTAELDTPAIIEEGRTMVPLRYISEKLGAAANWVELERRIEIER